MKPTQRLKKGLYIIPSAFTCANLSLGFYAMIVILRGFHAAESGAETNVTQAAVHFDTAAKAIGWAMLFDTLDGRIARLTKTTTEIGIQFDTIADVVTFGIAPALLIYAWGYGTTFDQGTTLYKLGLIVSLIYLICGAFRLGRFNVQAARPRVLSEGTAKLDKKSFVGLPIPGAALLLAALVHFAPLPLKVYEPNYTTLFNGLIMALLGSLSILMVSKVRFPSFKSVETERRSGRLVMLLIIALITLIWFYSHYILLALTASYVLYGLLMRLKSFFQRRSRAPWPPNSSLPAGAEERDSLVS